MKIFLALVILAGICMANGFKIQTDWVGGPGTAGPATGRTYCRWTGRVHSGMRMLVE